MPQNWIYRFTRGKIPLIHENTHVYLDRQYCVGIFLKLKNSNTYSDCFVINLIAIWGESVSIGKHQWRTWFKYTESKNKQAKQTVSSTRWKPV